MKTGSWSWVMDTDSFFLALAEEKSIDEKESHCIRIFADTILKRMQRKTILRTWLRRLQKKTQ